MDTKMIHTLSMSERSHLTVLSEWSPRRSIASAAGLLQSAEDSRPLDEKRMSRFVLLQDNIMASSVGFNTIQFYHNSYFREWRGK